LNNLSMPILKKISHLINLLVMLRKKKKRKETKSPRMSSYTNQLIKMLPYIVLHLKKISRSGSLIKRLYWRKKRQKSSSKLQITKIIKKLKVLTKNKKQSKMLPMRPQSLKLRSLLRVLKNPSRAKLKSLKLRLSKRSKS